MLSQSGEDGLRLLEEIQQKHGGKIYEHLKAGEHKATKSAYKLYWNKIEGIKLCQAMIPHLILKKQLAENVLTYLTRDE